MDDQITLCSQFFVQSAGACGGLVMAEQNSSKKEVMCLSHGRLGVGTCLFSPQWADFDAHTDGKELGCDLGCLSMETKVTAVDRTAFYHLRPVRQLVPYLSTSNLATVIQIRLL